VVGNNNSSTITACYWLKLTGAAAKGIGSPAGDSEAAPFAQDAWPQFTTDWLAYKWTSPGDETAPGTKYWKSLGQWSSNPADGSKSVFPKLYWEP
jgi:hypothetical protein